MKFKTQMYVGAPWCLGRYESFEVDKPKLITLLNHDYVIWRDKAGKLNAIDKRCSALGGFPDLKRLHQEYLSSCWR